MDNSTSPRLQDRFQSALRALDDVIDAVGPDSWESPTPCEGWTARDVVAHLIETQREFLVGRGLEVGPEPDLEGDPAAAWRLHAGHVGELIADPAVTSQPYEGYFGPTTVGETIERFYVFDMVVHRWDLARSVGADDTLSDEELDAIETSAAGFGDALYGDGICRPGVVAPPGADRRSRALALLGRVG